MLKRIRLRLTMGYVGILALILILFGTVVVIGFSQQTINQQDELLTREAESKQSVIYSDNDEDNGDRDGDDSMLESEKVAWSALASNGDVIQQSSNASALGLP